VKGLYNEIECVPNWRMTINMMFRKNNLREITIEYIFLQVPVRLSPVINYDEIYTSQTLNGWYVIRNNNKSIINLVNKVHIKGISLDNRAGYDYIHTEQVFQEVIIPIENITWAGSPQAPQAIDAVSDVNIALIEIVPVGEGFAQH
jgi:hypothetical protein